MSSLAFCNFTSLVISSSDPKAILRGIVGADGFCAQQRLFASRVASGQNLAFPWSSFALDDQPEDVRLPLILLFICATAALGCSVLINAYYYFRQSQVASTKDGSDLDDAVAKSRQSVVQMQWAFSFINWIMSAVVFVLAHAFQPDLAYEGWINWQRAGLAFVSLPLLYMTQSALSLWSFSRSSVALKDLIRNDLSLIATFEAAALNRARGLMTYFTYGLSAGYIYILAQSVSGRPKVEYSVAGLLLASVWTMEFFLPALYSLMSSKNEKPYSFLPLLHAVLTNSAATTAFGLCASAAYKSADSLSAGFFFLSDKNDNSHLIPLILLSMIVGLSFVVHLFALMDSCRGFKPSQNRSAYVSSTDEGVRIAGAGNTRAAHGLIPAISAAGHR